MTDINTCFEDKLNKNSVLWKTFFIKLWQKFNGYD